MNKIIAEVIYVNTKNRSALVYDEVYDRTIEVSLNPMCRDDDVLMATAEDIPKEGNKVFIDQIGNEFFIAGPAPRALPIPTIDSLKMRRKLLGVNDGDTQFYGLVGDLLPIKEGVTREKADYSGSSDPILTKNKGQTYSFSGNSIDELLPGDKIWITKDGNAVAILEGGVSVFKASELCQIIGIKYDDLMRIVSRNFEQFLDFGNVTSKNEGGRTSYVIEGSASASETKAGRITSRLEMGSEGDLIKLSVLGGGKELSKIHLKADGSVAIQSQNYTNHVYGNLVEIVHGERIVKMQRNYNVDYKSDYDKTIHGSENRSISNNKVLSIQNDEVRNVGRNVTRTIGGVKTETISGSLLGDAVSSVISNGSKVETISTKGNFIRKTAFGDVNTTNNFGDNVTVVNSGDLKIFVNTIAGGGNIIIEAGNAITPNKIEMTPTGGIIITDTNLNKVEMTSSGIKIHEPGTATLNLSATKVALGNQTTEVLDQFSATLQLMMDNITEFLNCLFPTNTGPTGTVINPAPFVSLQTQMGVVKGKIDALKGSI